jgi:hypothetical protein
MGEAIWFEEEGGGRGGYVSEMEQAARTRFVMRVDGLPSRPGRRGRSSRRRELGTCGGSSIVVPQGATVDIPMTKLNDRQLTRSE